MSLLDSTAAATPEARLPRASRRDGVGDQICPNSIASELGSAPEQTAARRLFERLVALGGARELTGRKTFRIFGL